ncbi:DnaJ family domain-containing protein [Modestobacter lacusdianchii]
MTERKPEGMTFESWVEHQIVQARERGDLEGLAGAGKPLPRRDREKSSYEWALEWAKREEADVAAMLPTGLALRKEREELPARVARQPTEELARAVVEAHVARVDQYYRRPVEGPWVPVGMPDVEEVVAEWRRTRPAVVPEPVAPALAPPRRRWLRRRAA